MSSRRRPRLVLLAKRFALLLGGTVLAALAGEVAVRLLAPQATAVPWQDEMDGVTCPRPNVRGTHSIPGCFDVEVAFGPERFRGARPYAPRPAEGVLRVAVLGDSFVFGYGAEDDETYPARLEEVLAEGASARGWSGVEVVNAGNGGTGPGDQSLWYDVWVRDFAPRVVVLSVVSNDLDNDLERGLFRRGEDGAYHPRPAAERRAADDSVRTTRSFVNSVPGYSFLAERSQLLAVARNAASRFLARRRGGAPAAPDEGEARARLEAEAVPLLAGEVRWLAGRVRGDGARLAVVFLPGRECVLAPGEPASESVAWRSRTISATLERVTHELGLPFQDLTAAMRRHSDESDDPIYYEGLDTHPTPAGYRVFAKEVGALLARSGSIDR